MTAPSAKNTASTRGSAVSGIYERIIAASELQLKYLAEKALQSGLAQSSFRESRLTGQSPPGLVGLLNLAELGNDLGKAIAEPVKETSSGVVSKIATEHHEDMLGGVQRIDQTRQVGA